MKPLNIIQCCEDLPRFIWECQVQLHSARKYRLSQNFRVIVFLPAYNSLKGFNPEWKTVEKQFPEAQFFYYTDLKTSTTDLMVNYNYTPIHRLCSLERHFKEYSHLEKEAIFYIDSDVIFTSPPPLASYKNDDNNYLSDTHTYLNEEYLSSQIEKVLPSKREEYEKIDPVSRAASIAKISKEILKENNTNCGGAQYLLKNMSSKFFSECINICLLTRMFFQNLNQAFFPGNTIKEREDNGIQSWCADMWAIQWNLYRHNLPCSTPKWMDFAWATDEIEKLENVFLLHNAGITNSNGIRITKDLRSVKNTTGESITIQAPALYKEAYKTTSIFNHIEDVENVINNPNSNRYCTAEYAKAVLDTYKTLIKTKENE